MIRSTVHSFIFIGRRALLFVGAWIGRSVHLGGLGLGISFVLLGILAFVVRPSLL